jgi:hypothetical protein
MQMITMSEFKVMMVAGGATDYFKAQGSTGEVQLYHYGAEKLATKSTGVDVTGTVTADDEIIVDGDSGAQVTIRDTGRSGLQLSQNNTGGGVIDLVDASENLHIRTQSTNNIRIQSSGDISFYEDSGTSEDFYWDASTSRLGIRNTSPTYDVDIVGAVNTSANLKIGHQDRTTTGRNSTFLRMQTTARASDGVNRYSRYDFEMTPLNDFGSAFLTLKFRNDGVNQPDVLSIRPSGDIAFFAQDGTTSNFFWDKSTSRLGLGTTTPATTLDVTGTVTADGATIDGTLNVTSNALNLTSSSPVFTITDSDTSAYHQLNGTSGFGSLFLTIDRGSSGLGGGFYIQRNANTSSLLIANSTGDISFYDDSGTSQDFYWDASTSRLGIGTTSPDTVMEVVSSDPILTIRDSSTALANASSTLRLAESAANDALGSYWDVALDGSGGTIDFTIGNNTSEAMRIDSSGNLLVGGTGTPTSSVGNFVLYNGTAPTGNATNGVILYAEDVSASSELKVRDEAGNVTTLSPHNFNLIPEGPSEDMAWSYYSERDGKRINVDMLKAIRLLEQLTGEKLVHTS